MAFSMAMFDYLEGPLVDLPRSRFLPNQWHGFLSRNHTSNGSNSDKMVIINHSANESTVIPSFWSDYRTYNDILRFDLCPKLQIFQFSPSISFARSKGVPTLPRPGAQKTAAWQQSPTSPKFHRCEANSHRVVLRQLRRRWGSGGQKA